MRYSYLKYQVMLFGLFNAFASFQGYVNKILAKKLDVFIIMYLNDMLIYTKNGCQIYMEAIWWVFRKLRKHDLFANLKKCRFHKEEVRFLGYVVFSQKICMEEERIDAVKA